jgi:hypothetical protein
MYKGSKRVVLELLGNYCNYVFRSGSDPLEEAFRYVLETIRAFTRAEKYHQKYITTVSTLSFSLKGLQTPFHGLAEKELSSNEEGANSNQLAIALFTYQRHAVTRYCLNSSRDLEYQFGKSGKLHILIVFH